ncbi:MAG: hypothetical protein ACRD1V_02050 [Vicinamibacterales bacterium]
MLTLLHRLFRDPASAACYGPALDTVGYSGTAINTTLAAGTIFGGDSFQIRNTNGNTPAWLIQAWSDHQAAGQVRIRSPKFHDNVDGLRWRAQIGVLDPQIPNGAMQMLYPQDILIGELAGSATAGDIESVLMQIYYPDLPGANANLKTWDQVKPHIKNLVGMRIAMTIGSTAGYNGARAINADVDLLKANTYYALMGGTTDIETAAITIKGPDTSNLRVAFPGENSLIHEVNWWFKRLSQATGFGLIPCLNSANKGATQVEVSGDENGGTCNVTLWLAELDALP